MVTRLVLAVFVALLVGGALLGAQATSAPRDGQAGAFKRAFVEAMARRDRNGIAGMVKYPATALVGGFNLPMLDRSMLLEVYNVVFTPELRCLVDRGGVTRDASGATLASGRVRLMQEGGALKITRINVPPADGSAPPPPSEPQRAFFRKGQAQFAGRLYGDGVDAYIVHAGRPGTLLEARIERFAGRQAFVRVIDPRTGEPFPRPGGDAPRTWAGTLQQSGDYRVEVVRIAPYCEPPFTYLLTMTLR
jgi:hypothetical protein